MGRFTFTALARTVALACLTFAVSTATMGQSHAQAISQNASNEAEYQTYINSYMAWAFMYSLPNAVQSDIDNANSYAKRIQFETERNLAYAARSSARAAFNHAYVALRDNDNSQWSLISEDLGYAIADCEKLLSYQQQIGASASRRSTVNSTLTYLDRAMDNAWMANFLANGFGSPVDIGGGRP